MKLIGNYGPMAVSYTHLDVYKRQAYARSSAANGGGAFGGVTTRTTPPSTSSNNNSNNVQNNNNAIQAIADNTDSIAKSSGETRCV